MKKWEDIEPKIRAMLMASQFPCKACGSKIRHGQHKYYCPDGNLYHDYCSKDMKERVKIS